MNWVAVDLGNSTIKASVLDNVSKPVRLSYPMTGYETTLLSSLVAVTDDENVVIGDYASLLGINNPNILVYNWLNSPEKSLIAVKILETVKQASVEHYSNQNIGVVLLHNNSNLDPELREIAKTIFKEVKTIQVSDVVKRIISPNSDLILIADLGESAFRVTVQEKSKCLYQSSNTSLGFSSFDMLSLIDCKTSSSLIETTLMGQVMQRIKILANKGEKVVLPDALSAKGISLADSFEQKMTLFLYQCFEECSNAVKAISKSWQDMDEVVFIGGGANSSIINTVFYKYMQRSYCSLASYNSWNLKFDAQFAASHCAIQLPELIETEGVIVKHGGNFIG